MFYIALMVCFGVNDCVYAERLERYNNKQLCETQIIFAVETTRIIFRQNGLEPSVAGICLEAMSA
jgi:hypothetical protein